MSEELVARSLNSASNLHRRKLCPGSAFAELHAPESSGKDAEIGTRLHLADAEDEDLEDISQDDLVKLNKELKDAYITAQLEQRGIPLDARRKVVADLARYRLAKPDGTPALGVDGKPFSGQPDLVVYFPDYKLLIVQDSKYGRIPVDRAECNYQIRANVVMAAQEFDQAETVLGVITQPLASPNTHGVEYDRASIAIATVEVLRILEGTESPDAERVPSVPACRYCRAKPSCPPHIRFRAGLVLVRVSELPVAQLEAMAPSVELAEIVCKAYWDRIEFIAANQPHLLRTLELKPNNPNRSIPPENVGFALALLRKAGVLANEQDSADVIKLLMGKLGDKVAKRLGVKKKDAAQKLAEILGDLIVETPKKPSLVAKKVKEIGK